MGRAKVQLKLIEKRSERISAYRRRLSCLKRKANELSTLCDVPALIISFDSDGKIDTFPENKEDVKEILSKYSSLNSKVPEKRRLTSESVMEAQILKKKFELNMLKQDNKRAVTSLLHNEAIGYLDSMLDEVQKKILLKKNQHMQMWSDMNNLQLVTTGEESGPCDDVLGGDMTCHVPDDLLVDDYLNGGRDFQVENYLRVGDDFSVKDLHGRENLSREGDFLGSKQFKVEHSQGKENLSVEQSHGGENSQVLAGGEKLSIEDARDWQVAGSAQSNDVLSEEIACLLDECDTWYYYP